MKIIGISGSPRYKNTYYMLKTVLEATGKDYELILLKDKRIEPCTACGGCYESYECIVEDDMQDLYRKLEESDIIVLGSPTYFDNVTGIMKNFIDRTLPIYLSGKLTGKKAAIVTVGNFKDGEVKRGASEPHPELEERTVKKCLDAMESYCNHVGLNVIGSVFATQSNPDDKQGELIQLGEKLIS